VKIGLRAWGARGLGAFVLLGALAAPALAAEAVDRQARVWASSCAGCHGPDGRSQGAFPCLAGRNADDLYRAMLEFKTGRRSYASVMHQHASAYTDDELRRIARYFAAQSPTSAGDR